MSDREPLNPEACGECSACKKHSSDPWKCLRPWGVGKLLGPLGTWYDPDTGLKKDKSFSSGKTYASTFEMDSYFDRRDKIDDWSRGGTSTTTGGSKSIAYEKCAHKHLPLVVPLADGTSVTIYGGAAASPVVKDCDIYVELDAYSAGVLRPFPWEEQDGGKLVIKYPITDMQAPKDPVGFKKMVKWIVAELLIGKKVHIGCIGGHGRTGTLLSAVVKELNGNVDAISFIRENYCKKAVESDAQVSFLGREFGIKAVKGYKSSSYSSGNGGQKPEKKAGTQTEKFNSRFKDLFGAKEVTLPIEPVAKKGNIWYT